MWRQGDILIETIESIPERVERLKKLVLASGDSTGHSHRIRDGKNVALYRPKAVIDRNLYLDVLEGETAVEHQEHGTITLPVGRYRVWRQREFTDQGDRTVRD